jgi:hypothetical protein
MKRSTAWVVCGNRAVLEIADRTVLAYGGLSAGARLIKGF